MTGDGVSPSEPGNDTPASGLRILEIGDSGEVAGKLLGDAGADVIRVEPLEGARSRHLGPFVDDRPDVNRSLRYAYFNTSKRGVTLDLSHAAGRDLWLRLVRTADVVIDGSRPGALDELGVGYERCAAPGRDGDDEGVRVVWCSITPFGLTGPRREWSTTDLVQLALGGPMMSTGYDDHELPPIRPDGEHSLWMGGEYATSGILAALHERERSGLGQHIDVSIHEAVSATTEGAFPNWEYQRRLVQRQTGRHSSVDPTPRWQFLSADGRYLNIIGGGLPRPGGDWDGLLAWLDEDDAAAELHEERFRETIRAPRSENLAERQRASEVVEAFVGTLSAEDAYRRAQKLHLPWGIVRRPEDNLDDPHWDDRGYFHELDVPGHRGPVRFPGSPYRFERTPIALHRRAPLLGEHNHEVYADELGVAAGELPELAKRGVI